MTGTRFAFEVRPRIPAKLTHLETFANDLLYSWERTIRRLFSRLDPELWEAVGHNPKVFLRRVSQDRLQDAAEDRIFMEDYNRAVFSYDAYHRERPNWGVEQHLDPEHDLVAYFCAEFGFHESLPIYSGGLGILAGDHCKAASDLGLPFVAVGILYRQGYFTQTIDSQGHQIAHYHPTRFEDLPITPARDAHGREIQVSVDIQGREVALKVWRAKAGHIQIILLDSDLPQNSEHDRRITYQLYGGDRTTRIQQEIVLGIGGVRALRALGLTPTVWHNNEGHAAFSVLERARELVAQGHDFDSAWEAVAAATVFTTHTPVPAGHDVFHHELVLEHFGPFIEALGITPERFLALGAYPEDPHAFNQTALALRGSRFHNGVSRIHGEVASRMEAYVWPQVPPEDNPMGHVTNGVHVPTFLASEWANLFDMRFGREWRRELNNPDYWRRIDDIPDHLYWSVHQTLKSELIELVRRRLIIQHRRNGCSEAEIERITRHLDPQDTEILLVGFARRFATYKRAALLFSDPERLARLVNDSERPVIFLFAGKAHPQDEPGKQLIKTIHEFAARPEFEGKILLLEGYDMALARAMVTGVDVWLNTPRYPLEASGTSGMKAGINGVLNLSVLDGWWGEGYDGENGWAIAPHGPEFDEAYRDHQEAQDLLGLLEHQVVPLYYDRSPLTSNARHCSATPEGWIARSKASMRTILPRFSSHRMVMDYVTRLYSAATAQRAELEEAGLERARELARWKDRVHQAWPNVRIRALDGTPEAVAAGEPLPIRVAAYLDGLAPSDVVVECVVGKENELGEFIPLEAHRLAAEGQNQDGETLFSLELHPSLPGLQFYQIRLFPYHPNLSHRFETGLMLWL